MISSVGVGWSVGIDDKVNAVEENQRHYYQQMSDVFHPTGSGATPLRVVPGE